MKIYHCFKNFVEGNISQEFRFKYIDETRNYFHEEIEQNELMCNVCTTLNYIEHFPVLAFTLQLLDVFQFLHLILCLVFLEELPVLQ